MSAPTATNAPVEAPPPPPFSTPSSAEMDWIAGRVIKREQFSEEQELMAKAFGEAVLETLLDGKEVEVKRPRMPRRNGLTTVVLDFARSNPHFQCVICDHRFSMFTANTAGRKLYIVESGPDSTEPQLRVRAMDDGPKKE